MWVNWQCAATLEGHSQAVWAVLGFGDDDILSGETSKVTAKLPSRVCSHTVSASADKTIRRWRKGKTAHVFTGHTDAVRGLAALSSSSFASCSNDG